MTYRMSSEMLNVTHSLTVTFCWQCITTDWHSTWKFSWRTWQGSNEWQKQ